ncbi:MAG: ferredoxin [Nitrososphaerales archaeon]
MDQRERKSGVGRLLRTYDPLVILGIFVLILGVIILSYGLIPRSVPNYQLLEAGPIPGNGPFISNPEQYFKEHYNGTGSMDYVYCNPGGTFCYGYQYMGPMSTHSNSSILYGGVMIALAAASIFAGYWFEPLKPRGPHLRPITIRVDEDLCVANSVCVNLAPTVFQLKKIEGPTLIAPLVYVLNPAGADNDTIIQAAQMCPTGAIIIEDAETGERIHPPLPQG